MTSFIYSNQLKYKYNLLLNEFKIDIHNDTKLHSIISIPSFIYNYRNKNIFNLNYNMNLKVNLNYSFSKLVCSIKSLEIKEFFEANSDLNKISSIMIKENNKGDILLKINKIDKNNDFINLDFINILINKFQIKSLYINNNNFILSNKYITEKIAKYYICISPDTFSQPNYKTAIILYDIIKFYCLKILNNNFKSTLYLIAGDISALFCYLNNLFYNIIAMTNDKSIYNDALETVKINNLSNINLNIINYETFLFNNNNNNNITIINPGRTGMKNNILLQINNFNGNFIIYMSCNIKTFKRDINVLTNWKINEIYPIDQLPHTNHIELIVLLQKKKLI